MILFHTYAGLVQINIVASLKILAYHIYLIEAVRYAMRSLPVIMEMCRIALARFPRKIVYFNAFLIICTFTLTM